MKNENKIVNKTNKKQIHITLSKCTVTNVLLFLLLSIPAIANVVIFLIWWL